jgi:hypothetical protein
MWLIACSADGTRLLIADKFDSLYTSLDSGQTWVTNYMLGTEWTGLAMSADGSLMLASAYGGTNGGIYVAQIPAQPSLSIAPSGTNLALSWPLPSTGFVLQQSADLTSTNWANVTNTVTPTNYWNQVTVSPPASGNVFYRLVNP